MSPRVISAPALQDPPLIREDDTIEAAVTQLSRSKVSALPVVDGSGRYKGIFGEREFFEALFPGYLGQLHSTAFLTRSIDDVLEKRESCRRELVRDHMNTEHVDVGPDFSDTQIAEIFLHHRVLIIPVIDADRVTGVITRHSFFQSLAERFLAYE